MKFGIVLVLGLIIAAGKLGLKSGPVREIQGAVSILFPGDSPEYTATY